MSANEQKRLVTTVVGKIAALMLQLKCSESILTIKSTK